MRHIPNISTCGMCITMLHLCRRVASLFSRDSSAVTHASLAEIWFETVDSKAYGAKMILSAVCVCVRESKTNPKIVINDIRKMRPFCKQLVILLIYLFGCLCAFVSLPFHLSVLVVEGSTLLASAGIIVRQFNNDQCMNLYIVFVCLFMRHHI